jgi:hypothetical protein
MDDNSTPFEKDNERDINEEKLVESTLRNSALDAPWQKPGVQGTRESNPYRVL